MYKRILTIITVLFIVITISCKEEPAKKTNTETDFFSNAIEENNIDKHYKWLVILPGLGCHGCIQEGESFMENYIAKDDILFILTKVESLKILQKKININIKDHTNILIDKEELFYIGTDNSIYPCIIELEKGKLKKYEFQSPKNSGAFRKLRNKI